MKITHRFWRYLLMPISLAGMLSISSAAELNPAAVIYKLPDQIPWSPVDARRRAKRCRGRRSEQARLLYGLQQMDQGQSFQPAALPSQRPLTSSCCKGTWWVGTGPKFDPANTTPMPAGSFVTHFGKQVHWDGAKDEDAVLLIMGEGPATAIPAEEK